MQVTDLPLYVTVWTCPGSCNIRVGMNNPDTSLEKSPIPHKRPCDATERTVYKLSFLDTHSTKRTLHLTQPATHYRVTNATPLTVKYSRIRQVVYKSHRYAAEVFNKTMMFVHQYTPGHNRRVKEHLRDKIKLWHTDSFGMKCHHETRTRRVCSVVWCVMLWMCAEDRWYVLALQTVSKDRMVDLFLLYIVFVEWFFFALSVLIISRRDTNCSLLILILFIFFSHVFVYS